MQSREHISFLRRALSESALRQPSAKLSPHTFWICVAGLNRPLWNKNASFWIGITQAHAQMHLHKKKSWENKTTDLYAAVVSRHSWLAKQTPYHAPTQAKKNVVRFEKLTTLFFTRWYRENAAWRQAKTLSPLFEMIRKLEPKCVPQLRLGSLQRTHWSAIGQCSYLSSRFAHVPSCIARQYQGLPA